MNGAACGCDPTHRWADGRIGWVCEWHRDRLQDGGTEWSCPSCGKDILFSCKCKQEGHVASTQSEIHGAHVTGQGTNTPMRQFKTGATRGTADVKIDFEGHISPEVLHHFGAYMHKHRITVAGDRRDSDNWQKGIPMSAYMKSLIRHVFDLWRAWRGFVTYNPETGKVQNLGELGAAILFNVQGLLHELLKEAGGTALVYVTKEQRLSVEAGRGLFPEAPLVKAPGTPIHADDILEVSFKCPQDGRWCSLCETTKACDDFVKRRAERREKERAASTTTTRSVSDQGVRDVKPENPTPIVLENLSAQQLKDAGLSEGSYRLIVERERY